MDVKSLILVGAAGYIGVLFRNIPANILKMIMYVFTWEVMSTSTQGSKYNAISDWVMSTTKSKAVFRRSKHSEEWRENIKVSIKTLGLGRFYEWRDGTLSIYVHYKEDSKAFEEIYVVRVMFIGRNAKLKYEELSSRLLNNKPIGKIRVIDQWSDKLVESRDMSTVYSPNKEFIMSGMDRWMNSSDIHARFGKIHKMGLLLYGPPGTGKTSMVRALATHYGRDIVILDPPQINSSSVTSICNLIPSGSIVLIEEIDTVVAGRPKANKDISKNNTKGEKTEDKAIDKFNDPIYKLLNILDGVMSPSNVIFVATTNHIDKIDSALLREGRFDMKVCMDLFDMNDVRNMCDMHGVCSDDMGKLSYPVTPSALQNKIMERVYYGKEA